MSFAYEDAGGTTWYQNGLGSSLLATTNPAITGTPTGSYLGKIVSVQAYVDPVYHPLLKAIFVNGVHIGLLAGQYTGYVVSNFRAYIIERTDGLPDDCGDPPKICPI